MGIIDFRVRPLVSGYRNLRDNGTAHKFLTAFRLDTPLSVATGSMEDLLREMDASGIELSVVPGRQSPNTFVPNEALLELAQRYPGRFEIFPLFNPAFPEESLREVKDLVINGPCKGVSMEPGFGNTLLFDSEEYMPLYSLLNEYSVPLMATFSGSITPAMDASLPGRFQSVAKRFPNIPMIAGHGGWPWLREMFCAAFFTANIYLVPDLYSVRCPGQDDVRLAAEYMLRDRMLFGSSYPLVPMDAAVKNVEDWQLSPDSSRAFLYENARKLLAWKQANQI